MRAAGAGARFDKLRRFRCATLRYAWRRCRWRSFHCSVIRYAAAIDGYATLLIPCRAAAAMLLLVATQDATTSLLCHAMLHTPRAANI